MDEWRELTRRQVLDGFPVLTAAQVAYVLQLEVVKGARKGEPDPSQVALLVARARLAPIDPDLAPRRWRFSSKLVARYIDDPGMIVIPSVAEVAA